MGGSSALKHLLELGGEGDGSGSVGFSRLAVPSRYLLPNPDLATVIGDTLI
jgi:hypothetical protein